MNIAVFCSASDKVTEAMKNEAEKLGQWIGENCSTLVYGGIPLGLMEAVAYATHKAGGRIIGVVPERRRGMENPLNDETIMVGDLHHRKQTMEELADAFIALPGGYGTLDEIISAWSSTGFNHTPRPLILLNSGDFYEPLRIQIEQMNKSGLLSDQNKNALFFAPDIKSAITVLNMFKDPIN